MKALLEKFEIGKLKYWLLAIVFAGLFALIWDLGSPKKDAEMIQPESPETAATYIPAGYVLVPIEVANYESLDSILGKFGVVDLFRPPLGEHGRPVKVAERVKILRAPLNPSHFAVLVRDADAPRLVTEGGAFTVVVQNPSRTDGTRFVNERSGRATHTKISRIAVEVTNGTIQ